jgi:hypothetical protein
MSGVYDHDRVSYLSCVRGFSVSYSGGEIHHGVLGILREGIWSAITLISPLPTMVLQLGTTSLDSFRDLVCGGPRDPVRGLHWDWTPF